MKQTLVKNENLIVEILEYAYCEKLKVKTIYKKIKKKISLNSIYSILSKFKLYNEYKLWLKEKPSILLN